MSLFTSPVTLNDGSADHIYNYRGQISLNTKSLVGEWIEPAADMSAQSRIFIKHDEGSSSLTRRLFQVSILKPIADGTLKRITVNHTINHHPEHSEADIESAIALSTAGQGQANYATNMLDGYI
jgi:hypothetical protein